MTVPHSNEDHALAGSSSLCTAISPLTSFNSNSGGSSQAATTSQGVSQTQTEEIAHSVPAPVLRSADLLPSVEKDSPKTVDAFPKGDPWRAICIRATRRILTPPNGYHLQTIVDGLRRGGRISDRENPAGSIFHNLRERMMLNTWVVVIKAQTVFHHIFREGNVVFVEYVANNSQGLFRNEFVGDDASEGKAYMSFVKSYGVYLEQWLRMKVTVNFPSAKSSADDPATGYFRDDSVQTLQKRVAVIMDTVDALLEVRTGGAIRFIPVANTALSMIRKDLVLLCETLSKGLALLMGMDASQGMVSAILLKRFIGLLQSMARFLGEAALERAKTFSACFPAVAPPTSEHPFLQLPDEPRDTVSDVIPQGSHDRPMIGNSDTANILESTEGPLQSDAANVRESTERPDSRNTVPPRLRRTATCYHDRLKDQFKCINATAKKDEWKIICIKATRHDSFCPKAKHVRSLMSGLEQGGLISDRGSAAGSIFYHLRNRMMRQKWAVAVKAQMIFHLFLRTDHISIEEIGARYYRSMFKVESLGNITSRNASQKMFIETYGRI